MLFQYTDGEFKIDYESLFPHAPFRALIGRHKRNSSNPLLADMFIKECIYMYHVAHPDSFPNKRGFSEKETHSFALEQSGLPIDWIPDDQVRAALDIYAEYHQSLGLEPILELRKTFGLFRRLVAKARQEIENKLESNKLETKDIENFTTLGTKLFDLSTQIPHKIEELIDAERLLRIQLDSSAATRKLPGGREILESMDGSEIDNA